MSRVLLVDDNKSLLQVTEIYLIREEPTLEIITTSSAEEAIQRLEQETIDVVVSDYQMPGMDGLEFLKKLRDESNVIPFILFTGKGREEVAIEALNSGADRYISKIGDAKSLFAELIHAIKSLLEYKKVQEALRKREEIYQSFVRNLQGIAFQSSLNFTPVFFHGTIEEITGYFEDDFVMGTIKWDHIIHPEDKSAFLGEVKDLATLPMLSMEQEYRIIRKDGSIRWIYGFIQNISDDLGKPNQLQGIFYDITKRVQAEEALRKIKAKHQEISTNAGMRTAPGK